MPREVCFAAGLAASPTPKCPMNIPHPTFLNRATANRPHPGECPYEHSASPNRVAAKMLVVSNPSIALEASDRPYLNLSPHRSCSYGIDKIRLATSAKARQEKM